MSPGNMGSVLVCSAHGTGTWQAAFDSAATSSIVLDSVSSLHSSVILELPGTR